MALTMAQGMKRLGTPVAAFLGVALIGLIATSWLINRDALREAVEAQIRAVTGLDLVVNGPEGSGAPSLPSFNRDPTTTSRPDMAVTMAQGIDSTWGRRSRRCSGVAVMGLIANVVAAQPGRAAPARWRRRSAP